MDKVAICYTCCGPTYRKTARDKLLNLYTDNDDIYYFVITDDVSFFADIERRNLYVKDLKEFYGDFPHVEKYEYFLESVDEQDYARKFIEQQYKFPFSTNRFHFHLAKDHDVKNIALLGTDTDLVFSRYIAIEEKNNKIYNCIGRWDQDITENNMKYVVDILNSEFNLSVDNNVRIFDAAGKLFCFESVDFMLNFFNIWDRVMQIIYETNSQNLFWGSYAVNNEYILAPIYNAIGITGTTYDFGGLFNCLHQPEIERFWL